jgi:Rps23 Pro-64 3,4-dihydroxylase Tpa1-like proline 4-hydroxylase
MNASSGRYAQAFVRLDEFLVWEELSALMAFTLEHKAAFRDSRVVMTTRAGRLDAVDRYQRRSRILTDLGPFRRIVTERIIHHLPYVSERLGCEPFKPNWIEAQITASNHGDYFRQHNDNLHAKVPSREITYVYFFHREPRPFEGGELIVYPSIPRRGSPSLEAVSIVPRQNEVICFASSKLHEVLPIRCRSRAFEDSRFTLNGWVHRPTEFARSSL